MNGVDWLRLWPPVPSSYAADFELVSDMFYMELDTSKMSWSNKAPFLLVFVEAMGF